MSRQLSYTSRASSKATTVRSSSSISCYRSTQSAGSRGHRRSHVAATEDGLFRTTRRGGQSLSLRKDMCLTTTTQQVGLQHEKHSLLLDTGKQVELEAAKASISVCMDSIEMDKSMLDWNALEVNQKTDMWFCLCTNAIKSNHGKLGSKTYIERACAECEGVNFAKLTTQEIQDLLRLYKLSEMVDWPREFVMMVYKALEGNNRRNDRTNYGRNPHFRALCEKNKDNEQWVKYCGVKTQFKHRKGNSSLKALKMWLALSLQLLVDVERRDDKEESPSGTTQVA